MSLPVTTATGERPSTSAFGASSGSWWTVMLWSSVVVESAETRAPKVVYRPRRTAATPASRRSHQRAERVVRLGLGPPPVAEHGRRDLVALDHEVDAQRELPHSLGERQDEARERRLIPGAEQHGGRCHQRQRTADEPDHRHPPRHEPGAEHQVSEQDAVANGGAECRAEQGRRALDGGPTTPHGCPPCPV